MRDMPIDAIALLRIPFDEMRRRFEVLSEQPEGVVMLRGATGTAFGAIALEDACAVMTGASFASEPADLSEQLGQLLGDLIEMHDDMRGIYVYPDVARPQASSYAARVDELGEGGVWLGPHAGASPALDLAELARNVSAGLPSDLQDQMERMLGPEGVPRDALASVAELLSGEHGGALLDAARQIAAGLGLDANASAPLSDDVLRQAQMAAEDLVASDPDMVADLAERLRVPGKPGGGDS